MTLTIPGIGPVEVPDAIGAALCAGQPAGAQWLYDNLGGLGFSLEDAQAFGASLCEGAPPPAPPAPPAPAIPTWAIVAGVGALAWLLWGRR
jgi:hypothetical protein